MRRRPSRYTRTIARVALAVVALAGQASVHLHLWQVGAPQAHAPAAGLAAAAALDARASVHRAGAAAEHQHHDPAGCPVCRALSQARDLVPPRNVLELAPPGRDGRVSPALERPVTAPDPRAVPARGPPSLA